jgi:hypothetical protein
MTESYKCLTVCLSTTNTCHKLIKLASLSLSHLHTYGVTLYRSLMLQLLRARDSHAGPGRQLPTMRDSLDSLGPVSRGCGDEPHTKGMHTSCLSPSLGSGLQAYSASVLRETSQS